jgi:hypothetical protein
VGLIWQRPLYVSVAVLHLFQFAVMTVKGLLVVLSFLTTRLPRPLMAAQCCDGDSSAVIIIGEGGEYGKAYR